MRVFLDTNVLIAACIEDHVHHTRAAPIVANIHEGRNEGFTSGHAVLELYSVLTRLPRAPRILASQAMVILQENVIKHFTLIALTGKEYGELVLKIAAEGAVGRQSYDALHLACARKCDSQRVYTFNARHFQNLVADDFQKRIFEP